MILESGSVQMMRCLQASVAQPGFFCLQEDSIWQVDRQKQQLLEMDLSTGQLCGTTQLLGTPGGVAAGHGLLWVVDRNMGVVWGFKPRQADIAAYVVLPTDIDTSGPLCWADPYLWLASPQQGQLLAIDLKTAEVAQQLDLDVAMSGFGFFGEELCYTTTASSQLICLQKQSYRLSRKVYLPSIPATMSMQNDRLWYLDQDHKQYACVQWSI